MGIKKRRSQVAHPQIEVFALPNSSNKQQETYAGMIDSAKCVSTILPYPHRHLLPTLNFELFLRKLRSSDLLKTKRQ